jgi:hypothetical protein
MDRHAWIRFLVMLVTLYAFLACAKTKWTADEVVGELRAYGLPTRNARPPAPGECPPAPGGVAMRRFEADIERQTGWGCIVQFEDKFSATSAEAQLSNAPGVARSSHRANIVLVLSDDFEAGAAAAYARAIQEMWGGE